MTVSVYNINLGHNTELLEACRLLKEYAQYVEQVRIFAKTMPFSEAVECAVDYCIENGILKDFLSKNRAEAIAVSIFEYDEEKHMKSEREEWRNIGRKEGYKEGRKEGHEEGRRGGIKEGQDKLAELLQKLMNSGRIEEMKRALSDGEYRERLYRENNM
ncbi:MAG: hypothetical protein NC400_10615 [Clostridium sp.]|nr:hypothetical protein [Clostridium sp.]